MSQTDSPASAVLETLGYAWFLRGESGDLCLQGKPPAWLSELWPSLTSKGAVLPVTEASPFLENFLFDAAECWTSGGDARASSGPWIEEAPNGSELSLEATALTVEGQPVFLLEKLGEVFEAKKAMLQRARETVIAYQRLNSETQKKEILLSCVAEEMNAALANAITALRLIEMEKHSPRAQQLLGLALRATEEQQALINKVLNVFAAELKELYADSASSDAVSSLGDALHQVRENVSDSFAEKRVELRWPNESKSDLRAALVSSHLIRVITSLLENALENAPAGGEVTVELTEQPETILLKVIDNGPALPGSVAYNLFSKDVTATDKASPSSLRLQFCRMAVEKVQGEFGYEPQGQRGNCFWIRLPRVTQPAA